MEDIRTLLNFQPLRDFYDNYEVLDKIVSEHRTEMLRETHTEFMCSVIWDVFQYGIIQGIRKERMKKKGKQARQEKQKRKKKTATA